MKCKACGQELSIDRTTGIGVCVGCNKKYKVSTIVKPKICSICNVSLVQNDAIWVCPTCGKKYLFSSDKKKSTENEAKQEPKTEEQPKPETDWREDLLNESYGDDEALVSSESNTLPQPNEEVNQNNNANKVFENNSEQANSDTTDTAEANTSKEPPTDELVTDNIVEEDDIIDDSNTNESIENDDIIDDTIEPSVSETGEETPIPSTAEEVIDDEIIVTEPEKAEEATAEEVAVPTNDFDVARNVEIDNQTKPTAPPAMPLLYDDDGSVFQNGNAPKNEVKPSSNNAGARTLSQVGIPKNQSQDKSKKAKSNNKSVGGIIIAVILGILSTLAGIGCYIISVLQNVNVASQMTELFATIQNVAALAFFAFFAVICFVASAKPIGAKRVGTIIGGIFAVVMIARRLLTILISSGTIFDILEKHGNIITYCIYAVCIFASFLTMVITCKTDFSKKATMAGVIFFVFSLLALLSVAIQMLPLESLNLSILEIAIPFMAELDKTLLAFGVMGLLSVIAKPRE